MGYIRQGRYANEITNGMRRKRVTATQLASQARISLPYLSQILSGDRNPPSPEITRRLASLLGIEPLKLHYLAGHIRVTDPRLQKLLQAASDLSGDELDDVIRRIRAIAAERRRKR